MMIAAANIKKITETGGEKKEKRGMSRKEVSLSINVEEDVVEQISNARVACLGSY